MLLTYKDIDNLPKGFSESNTDIIVFGLSQTNLLKATINWVQDFQSISKYPILDDIKYKSTFNESTY